MLTAAAYGMPPLGACVEFSSENPTATKEELAKAFQGIFSLPIASDLTPTFVDNLPFFMTFDNQEEAAKCLCRSSPTPPKGEETSPLKVRLHFGRYYAWEGSPSGYKKRAYFLYRVDPNHKLTTTQVKFLMQVLPGNLSFSQVFAAVKGGSLFKVSTFTLREASDIELPLQVSLSFSEETLCPSLLLKS